MKYRRFGIKDFFTWGFLAAAVVLLGLSLSVSRIPGNPEREAAKAENAVGKRMAVLEKYISNNLNADRKEWMGRYDLPEDMVIYRYIDDSLQSWSNQFPVKNDDISSRVVFQRFSRPRENITSPLAEVTEEVSFVNYGPKWYLVKAETLGTRKVIAGLEIIDQMDGTIDVATAPGRGTEFIVEDGKDFLIITRYQMNSEKEDIESYSFEPAKK